MRAMAEATAGSSRPRFAVSVASLRSATSATPMEAGRALLFETAAVPLHDGRRELATAEPLGASPTRELVQRAGVSVPNELARRCGAQ
jgi:hypothetical protein